MAGYSILTDKRLERDGRVLRYADILLDGVVNPEQAEPVVRGAVDDLLSSADYLRLFAYVEAEAVQWAGYVARAEAQAGKSYKVMYDNNPDLRESLWLALRGVNG